MKAVTKTAEHPCLANGRKQGWNWEEFLTHDHDGYLEVRRQALQDQQGECAYTGLWLGEGTSQHVHIDHFWKKSIYEEQTLVYANLFAAAKDQPYGSDYKDKMINGPRKDADIKYQSIWSPLSRQLNNAFWYRQDGYMDIHRSYPSRTLVGYVKKG